LLISPESNAPVREEDVIPPARYFTTFFVISNVTVIVIAKKLWDYKLSRRDLFARISFGSQDALIYQIVYLKGGMLLLIGTLLFVIVNTSKHKD